MNDTAFERVEAIFERVSAAPEAERAAVLQAACGSDAALRAEVESLLEHDARAGASFLASPAALRRAVEAVPASEGELTGGPALAHEAGPSWATGFVGRKLGRYTIVRVIGAGGMGCVFEATQEKPRRSVALKVLQPGLSSASALARFKLEPEVLGRLQHPHIAQVYEAGVHQDEQGLTPFFAMELIPEAEPIQAFAAARELSIAGRLELFAKVCEAVHHGHQKGIIHRDLKPANVLVGSDGEPKVIDFGVARASDADIVMTTQCTHVGDLIGTVRYMSPEQCDGDPAAIDTRSDVYSLGVMLYELVTGAAPYETSDTTLYAAIRIIKEESPRRPSAMSRRLRGDLEAILLKCLEKEPGRRYASAADLGQDIRRHLAGDTIEARPPGRWRALLLWAGRRPRMAAAVSGAALFVVVAVATLLSSQLYVQYYFNTPVAIQEYDKYEGTPSITLLNRAGTAVKTWDGGSADAAVLASWFPRFPSDPERRLIALQYGFNAAPDRAGQLQVYDINTSLDEPLWSWRVREEHIPPELLEQGMTAEQFNPQLVWSFDVFPKADGVAKNEVLCQFAHNMNSRRMLAIFSLEGELLYSVWHDGSLLDCYWAAKEELLIVASEDWSLWPTEAGCPETHLPRLCLFALRPTRGAIQRKMISGADVDPSGELVWYRWLSVCTGPEGWNQGLSRPLIGERRAIANYALNLSETPMIFMSWQIDASGERVPGTLVWPTYRIAREQDPSLPPVEDYYFQDSPTGP